MFMFLPKLCQVAQKSPKCAKTKQKKSSKTLSSARCQKKVSLCEDGSKEGTKQGIELFGLLCGQAASHLSLNGFLLEFLVFYLPKGCWVHHCVIF
jgi:hypothetical protein